MDDLISRQAAMDALERVASFFPYKVCGNGETYSQYNEAWNDAIGRAEMEIEQLPSAQPETNSCRTCKYVKFFGSVDKYGSIESSWYCKNWEGYTDEEGFCHEWDAKSEVNDEDR